MLNFLKKIISTKRYGFPKYKKDVWYNNGVWTKGGYPIVFDENKKYIECQKGLKVQMGITKCGKKVYSSSGFDSLLLVGNIHENPELLNN